MASNSNENTHTGVNLEGKLRFKLFKLRYLKNVDGHSSTEESGHHYKWQTVLEQPYRYHPKEGK